MQSMVHIYKVMVCIWLLALANAVMAQPGADSSTFGRLMSEDDLQHLIRSEARKIALDRKMDMADFDGRIVGYLPPVSKVVKDAFEKNNQLPKSTQQGGDFTQQQKANFNAAVTQEVRKLLSARGTYFSRLFARDFSDRILSFHSEIEVEKSGKLQVKETITIFNGTGHRSPDIDYSTYNEPNNDIQRGIVRDFPTRYLAPDGFWQKVDFKLKSVTNNGVKSNYRTESVDNGVRIMVGDADIYLADGIYSYVFTYETDRQLIYHEDKDEIYWNVNGSGWVFTADSVSCHIRFPEGASIFEYACYTGYFGATDRNCLGRVLADGSIWFSSTRRLEAWQGLTVAAAIHKGVLDPKKSRTIITIFKDNWILPLLSGLLMFLLIFYYMIWDRKGRDPKKGTIIPQLEPPADLTPADLGFIMEQKYGSHLFAAALVDMSVKGWLRIEVERKGLLIKSPVYSFKKPTTKQKVTPPRTTSLYGFDVDGLYGQEAERGNYNSTIKRKYDALQEQLKKRFMIRRGKTNTWHGLFVRNDGYTGFGGFLVFVAFIVSVVYIITSFTLNLLGVVALLVFLLITVHGFFVKIMSAYTEKGRAIADHIEGFKMYLETTEQRLFDYFTPPEKTLELFEKYLPYAIALKVENAWAQKFDSIVQKAIEAGYQPGYYSGSDSMNFGRSFNMSDMSRGLSSGLSSTIASASTPPSSSGGGSGGGGSSGGGGGGGGGGGW